MRAMSRGNPAGFAPRGTLSLQIRSLVTAVSAAGQIRTDGVHASRAEFLQIPDSRTEPTCLLATEGYSARINFRPRVRTATVKATVPLTRSATGSARSSASTSSILNW